MANPEVKLKVMEAVQDDINRGIVKIDSSFMRQIGINPGDIVEIKGERVTAAVADRAYPGDIGLNIIRMDGNIRRNARTSIGELVTIKKAEVKPAKSISIAPASKGVLIKASPEIFKMNLMRKAVVKGDLISLGRIRRKIPPRTGNINDIFSMMETEFASFGFADIKFMVVDTNPKKEIVVITEETEINFNPEAVELKEESISLGINYEDIGGLGDEIKKVREMIELPLKHPEIFERLGIEPPKGVLLHGPPGTGKTLLAKAVASETNAHFILINGPEVMSKFYGESEANLRKKFEEAEQNAPSIIFLDEIDAIATKREETKGDVEKRVVAQLLGVMDGLKSRGKVVVIAATNMPNLLDPALRRPGRFDREIEIGVPDKEGRLEILNIHTRNMPYDAEVTPLAISKQLQLSIPKLHQEKLITQKKIKGELLKLEEEKKEVIQEKEQLELKSKEYLVKNNQNSTIINLLNNVILKLSGIEQKIKELNQRLKELEESKKKLEKLIATFEDKKRLIKISEELKRRYDLIFKSEYLEKNISSSQLWKNSTRDLEASLNEIIEKLGDEDIFGEKIKSPDSEFYKSIRRDPEWVLPEKKQIAAITHGFVGADISALTKEAAMIVLRKILPELKLIGIEEGEPIPQKILDKLSVTQKDFIDALKIVRPSAMREVLVETPDVTWNDIGGLEDIKGKLKEAVEWPLKRPEAFKKMGIRPPRGVLLYGPPGTGKTLLAKAVAKESEANFILVNGPSLLSKWVGESEKAMREIFRKARQTAPTILFFDEIDSLVPRRSAGSDSKVSERIVNQMLTEMDGLESLNDVLVIGATNRPDIVDPALLRQGRFDRIIFTPVPDELGRKKIFSIYLQKMPIAKDVDMNKLSEKTEGYVGADIEGVCREAAMTALREDLKSKDVKMKHFLEALETVKPSVDKEIEDAYKQLENYFSAARAKQIKEKRVDYFG